ncbi:hypothetical protein FH972_023978 [Carpinus fangiana]|uniref:Uncharacterized protein n=1 Tax=Carpinus fangiana TaxID=176857 RepID=A0A5N6KX28_9ROSI|nr:hypothetical protein FH972_023978 [Carpinus fangiana]
MILAIHHLHNHKVHQTLDPQLLAAPHNIPIQIANLRVPPAPHILQHRAQIGGRLARNIHDQRLQPCRIEARRKPRPALQLRQRLNHQTNLGEQQAKDAAGGGVVQQIAVAAVEQHRQRVDDAVDGELLELALQQVERGDGSGGQHWQLDELVQQGAGGVREGAVRGARVVARQDAQGHGAVAGVARREQAGLGHAVGVDADEVVGAGGGVGEDGGVDLVDDAHAVLQEEDRGVAGEAVLDAGQGFDGRAGFDGDDELLDRLVAEEVAVLVFELLASLLGPVFANCFAFWEVQLCKVARALFGVSIGLDCNGLLVPVKRAPRPRSGLSCKHGRK